MGEKKAKKIQRKVSFLGVPGTGEALPGADSGRDQLRAGLWQKYGWLGTFLWDRVCVGRASSYFVPSQSACFS